MKWLGIFAVGVIGTCLLPSCASAKLGAGHQNNLAGHTRVAVADIGIRVHHHRNWLTGANEKVVPLADPFLEQQAVEAVQRNLIAKGFTPVERRRIREILQEHRRRATGLYREDAVRIGQLSGATALFSGSLFIRTENDMTYTIAETVLFPPMLLYRMVVPNTRTILTLNGRLVSVKDGTVLLSGETSIERRGFEMEHISEVVDEWFIQVHEI